MENETTGMDGQMNTAPRPQPDSGENNSNHSGPIEYNSGWSWGAFMFDVPFVFAIRKYWYVLIYVVLGVLSFIPIVNIIAGVGYLIAKIFFGIKGRAMAVKSKTFDSGEERAGFFKAFDWAGKVLFFITLAIVVVGIAAGALAFLSLSDANKGANDARRVTDLNQIQIALEQMYASCGTYPQVQAAPVGEGNDLTVTSTECRGGDNNLSDYLFQIPSDPNGGSYGYQGSGSSYCVATILEGDDVMSDDRSSQCQGAVSQATDNGGASYAITN